LQYLLKSSGNLTNRVMVPNVVYFIFVWKLLEKHNILHHLCNQPWQVLV